MRYLKLFGAAFSALLALGAAVTSPAVALPDLSLTLAGTSFPLVLDVTLLNYTTTVSTSGGAAYTAGALLILLATRALSSLGTYEALFQSVVGAGEKCHSEGDPVAEVLTKGTYHLVYTSLSPLTLGLLFLVQPYEITCGMAGSATIRGSMLASLSAGTEPTELTELTFLLAGNGLGKPSLTNYYNDGGTGVRPKLELNLGAGFVEAAQELGTILIRSLQSKMFVITNR
jgi:hypothetical protein